MKIATPLGRRYIISCFSPIYIQMPTLRLFPPLLHCLRLLPASCPCLVRKMAVNRFPPTEASIRSFSVYILGPLFLKLLV